MEETINALNENHQQLEKEWEEQFDTLKTKLGNEKASLFYQEQQIRAKIHRLQNQLEELKSLIKSKLKSTSKFSEDKRRERKEKLESILKNISTSPEEFATKLEKVKEGLSKRLTEEEIKNLCQLKSTLADSNQKLAVLQEQQQAQVEVLPK